MISVSRPRCTFLLALKEEGDEKGLPEDEHSNERKEQRRKDTSKREKENWSNVHRKASQHDQ